MQKIILTLTAVASIFIMSCNSNSSQKSFVSEKETVTPKEAAEILKGNALLIDVREPDELTEQSYDVKNSINIPLDSIESKINSIPKDQQVILACQKGGRSQKAFDLLKEKGFTNIANLEGGMNAWNEAGLPTKSGVTEKKTCCANPNSKDCNPDGTCKSTNAIEDKRCCSGTDKSKCATDKSSSISATNAENHLEVYAFHGTRQCETCKNMKANTKATLDKYFSEEMKSGKIVFQIIDVDDPKNEKLAEKFQATGTALMVDNVVNGKDNIIDWSDFAFDKANDAQAFVPELKAKISTLLK
jgi:rhodanese-related sulfurtransferase